MIASDVRRSLVHVCTILNAHNVDYLIVGGAAVSHYGFNRPSGIGQRAKVDVDLDFWYNPTVENFHYLINALGDLAVDTSELKTIIFDKRRTFLKIPHEQFHTDFLPVMEGLPSFRDSKGRAENVKIDSIDILILSLDDLIANKQAVNRKIDQSDIVELDKIRHKWGKRRSR